MDCPERRQALGKKARQYTAWLVLDEIVTIQEHGRDKHGRTIGDVMLGCRLHVFGLGSQAARTTP